MLSGNAGVEMDFGMQSSVYHHKGVAGVSHMGRRLPEDSNRVCRSWTVQADLAFLSRDGK